MAGSKSDRKINAEFTIFANNKDANDSVRVGYIDSKRGYISGLSVYEANKYAEKNPGTQFILATRDKVRYLNINEVNALKNEDTLPRHRPIGLVDVNTGEFDPCNTVRGFTTDPDNGSNDNAGGEPVIEPPITGSVEGGFDSSDNYKKYERNCKTRVELQGGGGVGAVATPIIGEDGSILHIRVINGGFGYRVPPQVRIIDDCKRGSGARGFSFLGETALVEENFDEDADVEEYDFTLGDFNFDPDDSSWGKVYSMSNQTVVGDWNPANVISLTQTTGFQQELQAYLAFLKGYDPNKPWWTTRDETAVKVTGDGKNKKANKLGGILFPVQTWKWGGERSKDDVFYDVEFEVYGQGTYKNRQIYFQFESEDGSHQFRVKGVTAEGRSGKTRTQLVSLKANTTYTVTSNMRKKVKDVEDLFGTRKLEQGLIEEAGRGVKEIGGKKAIGQRSKAIFADVIGSANDNDDIQVTANIGKFKAGERTFDKFDDSGIQNRQIKLEKSIDRIEARQLDLKKELAKDRNNKQLKEEHGKLTVELAKKEKEKEFLAKKLDDIAKNTDNRYRRGTFALTYRLNRPVNPDRKVLDSFINKYAVSPQMVSDQPGTDRAGKPYTLEYKEYFPHDGVYTFRGAADNISEVLFDGVTIMDISNTFNQKPVKKKVEVKEGRHLIQINLTNSPQKKIITNTYTADGGDKTKIRTVKFHVVGSGSGRHRKIKCVFTNKADPSDNFTFDNDGENNKTRLEYRKVTAGAKYDVKFIATAEKREDPNKETIIPIELAAPGTKGRGKKARLGKIERKKIYYLDERGDDPNAQLSIDSASPGVTAKFSDDGSKLITKGHGNVTLKFKWDDDPKSAGKAVGELKVSDKTFRQKGEKGEERQTIYVGSADPCNPESESTRVYPIKFNNLNSNNDPIHVSNIGHKLYLKDNNGKDVNAEVIIEDVKGGTAKFTPNGKGIEVKGDCQVRITLEWDDNPNIAGKALDSFEIGGKVWNQRGKEGIKTQTITLKGTRNLPKSYAAIIEQGCIENGTKNKETRASSSRVFADYVGSANDNDDMQVFVKKGGIFTSSNRRKTPVGRGTFDLEYVFDDKTGGLVKDLWQELKDQDIVNDKTGESLEKDDIQKALVFNTKQFIDKATRPLYRMRPDVGPFGDFFNRDGITPFNPIELDKEIPAVPPTVAPVPYKKPQAKFIERGGETFLKVIGTGTAKIGFRLKTDDNQYTSGVFAEEVKISADGPDVLLKRTKTRKYNASGKSQFQGRPKYTYSIKEKENIKGEGTFTAGKEYKITTIGGSRTSGFKPVDNTVIFDDDITNGIDKNAALSIRYVNPINPPKSKTPPEPVGTVDDYAGTHEIIWNDVVFPADGTYTVDIQVDDNVSLEIFNKKFKAQTLDVKGFKGPGKSNGMQTFSLEVKKGTYTIKALLQQIPGKPIYAGNPMGLAINIKTAYVTVQKEIILRQSWNQNPFGAALTIHAPPPPIPQEPVKEPEGPCPPNPIWTTRQPAENQWHPVSHRFASGRRSWSKFMNRYAMSPVLPIGTKGSGYSGSSWDNTWIANIPYTGFYNFKGTVDNFAIVKITQDPGNSEVLTTTTQEIKKIDGFRTEKKDLTSNKIFLEKGKAKIDINVRNGERIKYKQVTKKVFNTADWVTKPSDKSKRVSVDFDVFGQGSKKNMGIKFIFKEKGGLDTFTINNVDKDMETKTVTHRVKRNVEYEVTAIATGTHTVKNETQEYNIEFEDLNSSNRRIEVSGKNSTNQNDTLKLKDGRGSDANVKFTIRSTSPGVSAKFSDDGRKLITKGRGEVTIRLKYDDNPNYAGEAVRSITIAGTKWRKEKREYGEETKTIQVGGSSNTGTSRKNITKNFSINYNGLNPTNNPINVNSKRDKIFLKDGGGSDTNAKIIIEDVKGGTAEFSPDGRSIVATGSCSVRITLEWDDRTNIDGVSLNSFEIGGKVWTRRGTKGDKTQTITLDATQLIPAPPQEVKLVAEQGGSRVFGRGKKGTETSKPTKIIFADIVGSANDNDDMQIRCNKGEFTSSNKRRIKGTSGQGTQTRGTWDLTFKVIEAEEVVREPITSIGEGFGKYDVKNKELSRSVTVGPPVGRTPNRAPVILNPTLATYRRGSLGPFLSPFFPFGTNESGDKLQGRTWEMVWENVEFPIAGDYKMEIEADDVLEVFIGENLSNSFGSEGYKSIGQTRVFKGVEVFKFSLPKSGKRDIKLILQNAKIPGTSFQQNPTVAACKITCEVPVEVADQRSWLTNPVGISAVLLAPPCKRQVGGGGTVTAVEIVEPGNTYPPPGPGGIPSQVILTEIGIGKAGLGFTTGDQICIVKEDGTKDCYTPTVGEFGKITGVPIKPTPITRYPQITSRIPFVPNIITQVRIDTPEVDPETVIQITDLAGLKQTGYIEGRPYYGEVFYKDGVPFAGRYETAGRLIQVYATLQESIDAEVTTRPSAIQRSGTDVNSNNPRLNIPGTPDNLA